LTFSDLVKKIHAITKSEGLSLNSQNLALDNPILGQFSPVYISTNYLSVISTHLSLALENTVLPSDRKLSGYQVHSYHGSEEISLQLLVEF
jgi:hypothetical protein